MKGNALGVQWSLTLLTVIDQWSLTPLDSED